MRLLSLSVLLAVSACAADVEVWAVPSIYKVRPDEPAQASNAVWDGASRTVTLAGAKNEHVPFQVVVSTPPPPNRHIPAASGFFVAATDLSSAAGSIAAANVKLYFEHEILCYSPSSPAGGTGFWPDALAPLTDPFSMAAEFRHAVKNRAIWIDIVVPRSAAAGNYAGTVRVTKDEQPITELKVKLKVYDFALPEETHLITYMGLSSGQLERFHHVPPSSPEMKALLRNYHAFLYENRMEPWFNEALQPRIENGALHFDEEAYDLYMNRWKTKRVILESAPRELRADPADPRVKSYIRQVAEYYKTHGWLERLVLNSPLDEPATAEAFEQTRKWAALVHEAAPGVHFLATKTPIPEHPEWGTLRGYVNDFSIHGNDLNDIRIETALREERAKGGEMTWYISCDQFYPQPNYFIDAPAMDPVMVPWITWRYQLQGVLYWDVKFWPQTVDPWLNPVTYLEGFFCSEGRTLNGEGSLIYPGSEIHRYTGQKDVNGPVSSIRFELLREGIEDYEYLWMLKSLGDAAFADEAVRGMVATVGAFSRNPDQLYALRAKMAERIEQLSAKRR
jgi:hypothetical protein